MVPRNGIGDGVSGGDLVLERGEKQRSINVTITDIRDRCTREFARLEGPDWVLLCPSCSRSSRIDRRLRDSRTGNIEEHSESFIYFTFSPS